MRKYIITILLILATATAEQIGYKQIAKEAAIKTNEKFKGTEQVEDWMKYQRTNQQNCVGKLRGQQLRFEKTKYGFVANANGSRGHRYEIIITDI